MATLSFCQIHTEILFLGGLHEARATIARNNVHVFLHHVQETVSGNTPSQYSGDTINWTLFSLRGEAMSSKSVSGDTPPSAGYCLERYNF